MTGFGGGIESGYKKAAWTNQITSIVGKQIVNITVKETLEIVGGLIANAEEDKNGNLTDKGNLSVNCGRLIVKTIHDYDEGVTLGVGVSFQVKASETKGKEGEKEVTFDHAPLKVQLKDKRREISATIGQGAIAVGEITGDPLNRNITAQTKVTHNEEGSFDSVIHADMFDRLSGNLPKRPVSVKKIDTEAVRSSFDPDPSLITRTGYYFSDIAENFKDAIKDLASGGVHAVNFLEAGVDIDKLNARVYKLFGGEQYVQEFGSKLGLSSQQYETLIDKNLLERLTNNEFSTENKESVQELNNEVGIDALQKFLEDKIDLNAENKASLQALLHILKARYVKAAANAKAEGKSGVDFNQFVESLNNELFSKNPEFTARVGKDFAEGINIGKQIVIAYVYKIEAEKVKAEQEKQEQAQKEQRTREVTQAKQKQEQEQAQKQEELEVLELSFKNYEEYSRINYSANSQEDQKVEPNAEIFHYTDLFLQAKEQQSAELAKDESSIINFIKGLPIIIQNAWDESQKDSSKRREEGLIPSHDYVQEVYDNVYKIKVGDGYFVFKLVATMNQVVGASGRYIIDQAKQLLSYDPATKAVLNSAAHTVGYTIQAVVPDPALEWIGEQYKFVMGPFPTENERFIIDSCGGILLPEVAGLGLKMAVIPVKANTNSLLKALKPSIVEVGINDISITKLSFSELESMAVKDLDSVNTLLKPNALASAKLPVEYIKPYQNMINAHVERLLENGIIKLDPLKQKAEQIAKFSEDIQKKFLKYQNFDDLTARPYKMKIVGNAQHTGTPGHAAACMEIAVQQAQKEEVAMVFMDQGINGIFNKKFPTNNRPDVTVIRKTGEIDLFEVKSRTDDIGRLKFRMDNIKKDLPKKMWGKSKIIIP